jgi:hypothetical protein
MSSHSKFSLKLPIIAWSNVVWRTLIMYQFIVSNCISNFVFKNSHIPFTIHIGIRLWISNVHFFKISNQTIHTTSSATIPKHGIYYSTYYYVCDNLSRIWLHDYVVKLNLWLMPLVIYVISHVTFITTTNFITTIHKCKWIIGIYWLIKCRHMFKHNKATLIVYLPIY